MMNKQLIWLAQKINNNRNQVRALATSLQGTNDTRPLTQIDVPVSTSFSKNKK